LRLATMRAVETRRWLVRASNSGISAFIDPAGDVVASIPFGVASTLTHSVTPSQQLTPYVRFGDWIVGVSMVIVAVSLVRQLMVLRVRRTQVVPTTPVSTEEGERA